MVVLCGGRGTRMGAGSAHLPKPLHPIGGRPILWHILGLFARHGYRRHALALGWLGPVIRQWVLHMRALAQDFTLDVDTGTIEFLDRHDDAPALGWQVTCIDTGQDTETGGRVLDVARRVDADRMIVAYGDSLSDIDLGALVAFHDTHGKPATVTAVEAPSRWGTLDLAPGGTVRSFHEKPPGQPLVNGGFIVLDRAALGRFPCLPHLVLERDILPALAHDGLLAAYHHTGYWAPMDTPAEQDELERLWATGTAPWAARPAPSTGR